MKALVMGVVMLEDKPAHRAYPPDLVCAETLAYRLDCSVEDIVQLERSGRLPKPIAIGHLIRWEFEAILQHVKRSPGGSRQSRRAINGRPAERDEFEEGLALLDAPAAKTAARE
jgi:hypothetical protein